MLQVGVARSRVVVVCVTVAFLDGYPGRTASLRRSLASLMRLEGANSKPFSTRTTLCINLQVSFKRIR